MKFEVPVCNTYFQLPCSGIELTFSIELIINLPCRVWPYFLGTSEGILSSSSFCSIFCRSFFAKPAFYIVLIIICLLMLRILLRMSPRWLCHTLPLSPLRNHLPIGRSFHCFSPPDRPPDRPPERLSLYRFRLLPGRARRERAYLLQARRERANLLQARRARISRRAWCGGELRRM